MLIGQYVDFSHSLYFAVLFFCISGVPQLPHGVPISSSGVWGRWVEIWGISKAGNDVGGVSVISGAYPALHSIVFFAKAISLSGNTKANKNIWNLMHFHIWVKPGRRLRGQKSSFFFGLQRILLTWHYLFWGSRWFLYKEYAEGTNLKSLLGPCLMPFHEYTCNNIGKYCFSDFLQVQVSM